MRDLSITAFVVALLAACSAGPASAASHHTVPAATVSSQCRSLANAIDDSVMEMSALKVEGFADNSAVRATMRATQTSNKQTEIQNDILLMNSNKCTPYKHSLSPSTYELPAVRCATAKLTEQNAALEAKNGEQSTPTSPDIQPSAIACDRSKWEPLPGD
jgi:Tfp pilus assembly PilM family ATPase